MNGKHLNVNCLLVFFTIACLATMIYVTLHTNHTFTDEFYPFFEIIYTIEIFLIFSFYLLSPICLYMLWNARPFHRNLRLSLCSLVLQGLLGSTARLIFLCNRYTDIGSLDERPVIIFAFLLRFAMFEAFVGVVFFFSIERLIATFAWKWYEKASPKTIIVFVVLESWALVWSWSWSFALVFGIATKKQFLCSFGLSTLVGCSLWLFVSAVNWRAMIKLKNGATVGYSIARTFQIRENVGILKALARIGMRVMLLNVFVFILTLCHLFITGLENSMIARSLSDLLVSLYPAFIITYIPLSDTIFEKSLKRMPYGNRLFCLFSLLHCASSRQKTTKVVVINETDQYFRMLAEQFNGPAG